ncbi:phosphoprotein [Plecomyxo virus]|nr:phosphoprotein [Plecomyxo virus]
MSKNIAKDLEDSVDHGLQIAKFVQENREELQKQLTKYPAPIRIKKQNPQIERIIREDSIADEHGPIHSAHALQGIEEEVGETSDTGIGSNGENTSISKSNLSESSDNGGDKEWDAENNNGESGSGGRASGGNSPVNFGTGYPEHSGIDEFEGGSGVYSEDVNVDTEMDDDWRVGNSDGDNIRRIELKEPNEEMGEILEDILTEEPAKRSPRLISSEALKLLAIQSNSGLNPIKKSTGEKSQLMSLTGTQSLENGVIQSALESEQNQSRMYASVENALKDVATVNLMNNGPQSPNLESLHVKLDSIIQNQYKILEKFTQVNQINEEILGIKKTLDNYGLTLSTIESYITDLMIIIPKQGKNEEQNVKDINPDLKLVVGRDQRRALSDSGVIKNRNRMDSFGENIFSEESLDEDLFLEPINPKKNHAASFHPSNDPVSKRIVQELISQRIPDEETRKMLLQFLDDNITKMHIDELYEEIDKMLISIGYE